jgi:hypothetical protein
MLNINQFKYSESFGIKQKAISKLKLYIFVLKGSRQTKNIEIADFNINDE